MKSSKKDLPSQKEKDTVPQENENGQVCVGFVIGVVVTACIATAAFLAGVVIGSLPVDPDAWAKE